MGRCTGTINIIEILVKALLNTKQPINQYTEKITTSKKCRSKSACSDPSRFFIFIFIYFFLIQSSLFTEQ